MKKIFLVFTIFFSVLAVSGAELFYSDGTSILMEKSDELSAVKTTARDADNQKGAVYRMNTGKYVYSFVSRTEKKVGDELPVYFLGNEPVVAERTLLWRGEKPVEYMEKKYGMKLAEIFPSYPLYAFSVQGDSVEISEKIVKNGDGYAFADIVRETTLHFVPESVPQDAHFNVQWHLQNTGTGKYHYSNINLDGDILENADIRFVQALEFLNSNGIEADTTAKIAIMDTGVAPDHEDLTNIEPGYDALENKEGGYPDENVSDSVDHGTKCAGISAAAGNATGVSGVCPWCGIYPVKWQRGHGSTSHLISDLLAVYEKYVADPYITTINCSFGPLPSNGTSHIYPDTIEAIKSFMQNGRNGKGGVVVYSSGNDDVDSSYNRLLEYDFKFERNGAEVTDRVVTVNASTAWDTRAEYSNFGYASTVAAPSLTGRPYVGIATTAIPGHGDYPSSGSDYTIQFSGTSAAAPVVSGLFGVIFSINPDLTLERALEILKQSSDKINPETGLWDENGFSVKYGYGRVNLEKAVRLAKGFPMCAETKEEECGNHLDDDCDGYVDEGCHLEKLTTGKPCENAEDCRQPGSSTLNDVMCVTERLSWVFKGGYCFSKSFIVSNIHGKPCPDGTKFFDKEGYDKLCALECNASHPCEREGYYCSDEVLGFCLPLCSSNSDCANGAVCNENGHCVQQCGNGVLDDGEACDYGENNGVMDCAYGETSCKVCTVTCEEKDGQKSYCGDYATDTRYGEMCDEGYYNGRITNCQYGETSCEVCSATCQLVPGNTAYCGDGVRNTGYEACDDGNNDSGDYCSADCKTVTGRCGDGTVQNNETCDDGNTANGDYCSSDCQTITGSCGDGTKQSNEQCDNGSNNGATNCAYGQTSCQVCTTDCKTAAGTTSYCGDGVRDAVNNEACDNGADNGRTNCAYGETGCELCTTQCQKIAGSTSFCGDGTLDAANNEACDNGSDNGRTNCAYGETSCELCTNQCQKIAGATSYCGDGIVDAGNSESCDNGTENGRTNCAYGETSCSVCTSACKVAAGATSYCGDGITDSTNNEACDNGSDNGRTDCAYGETSCELCTNQCQKIAGATSYCGDGTLDAANNEACDNGSDNGRTNCAYGETSCELCTTQCQKVAGATSYCGDGIIDGTNGENCDDPSTNGQTYCVYGEENCTVCTSDCVTAAGITSYCGDGNTDSIHGEACDNGFDNGRTSCAYGETGCNVCTNECLIEVGTTSFCGDGYTDAENGEICDEGELNGEIDHCNSTCSGIVVEIPDDTPDEDIPDDDNPDEDAPDSDEITDVDETTDDNPDEDAPDGDETTDIDEISDSEEISDGNGTPDNEEHSDSEEVSDSSETPDEGGNQTDDGNSSSDETVETDDSSEEPSSDNENPATEDKKKSGGCSVLVL